MKKMVKNAKNTWLKLGLVSFMGHSFNSQTNEYKNENEDENEDENVENEHSGWEQWQL